MHLRTVISAVLILLLLPVSSVAAVCDMNCRTNGMPDIAMKSMSPDAGQAPGPAAHHHHQIPTGSARSVASTAVVAHQHFASHACCSGLLPRLNSPCVKSQNNAVQEQAVAPKCGLDSGIMQNQVSGLLLFTETLSRNSIPLPSAPSAFFHSLALRI